MVKKLATNQHEPDTNRKKSFFRKFSLDKEKVRECSCLFVAK